MRRTAPPPRVPDQAAPASRRVSRHRFRPGLERCEARALLATFTVTALTDTGAGRGNSGDLRYCIAQANANPGRDTVNFAVAGEIQLGSQLPSLAHGQSLALVGPGDGSVTIRGGGEDRSFSILRVTEDATATVSGLTLADGNARRFGGAIFNGGTLTVRDVVFSGNRSEFNGGAVFSRGTLRVVDSVFVGNTADESGGGIYSLAPITVSGSTFSSNAAANSGGAIESTFSEVSVQGTTFNDNASGVFGGAISVNGPRDLSLRGGLLTVTGSAFNRNLVGRPEGGGFGGAIASNDSTVTVRTTTFAENRSGRTGGGVGINGGAMIVADSTFRANTARHNAGGMAINGGISLFKRNKTAGASLLLNRSTFDGNTAGQNGGGLGTILTTAVVRNSSFTGNTAGGLGGGIAQDADSYYAATRGTLSLTNTTVAGNAAGRSGGGLSNADLATLVNSTVTGNRAGDTGGGIFNTKDLNTGRSAVAENAPDNVADRS